MDNLITINGGRGQEPERKLPQFHDWQIRIDGIEEVAKFTGYFTIYGGCPAIFSGTSPDDTYPIWIGNPEKLIDLTSTGTVD